VILYPSNSNRHCLRIKPAQGFSLIEIMVAVGLLAVIIVGLLAMFYHVQRAFRSGVTQSDIMENGRATMGLMARELQEAAPTESHDPYATNFVAMPSPGTAAWGESSAQDLPSNAQRKNFLQDISFLTRANGNWKGISYRIENNGGVGTLKRLEATLPYDPNPYTASNGLFKFSTDFFSSTVDNTNYHRISDGVVHLYVTAYDTNGFVFTNAWLSPNGGYAFTGYTNVMPAYVEIELGVLEPSANDRFRASLEVGGAAPQNYLRRQVGRTHLFRQRVSIRPAASQLSTD
jgi:prepilin-type N-terminal cleavage/methylation domain-containing protein